MTYLQLNKIKSWIASGWSHPTLPTIFLDGGHGFLVGRRRVESSAASRWKLSSNISLTQLGIYSVRIIIVFVTNYLLLLLLYIIKDIVLLCL